MARIRQSVRLFAVVCQFDGDRTDREKAPKGPISRRVPRRRLELPQDYSHWILNPATHEEEFEKCAVFVQFLFILLLSRREKQNESGKRGSSLTTGDQW